MKYSFYLFVSGKAISPCRVVTASECESDGIGFKPWRFPAKHCAFNEKFFARKEEIRDLKKMFYSSHFTVLNVYVN